MKIYTKTGDKGETSLYGGARVRKDDARVETYGTFDECNAVLGLAATFAPEHDLRSTILRLQGELLELGADLATPLERGNVVPRITDEHVVRLEKDIDLYEAELIPLRNFILPGGSEAGAHLHQARAVARRAERLLTTLTETIEINPAAVTYANRLSDYLFVLARYVNYRAKISEPIWKRPDRT